jgi:hypothetical protein
MKRKNEDGQMSRDAYDEDFSSSNQHPGAFSKATPNTLANRKYISAHRGENRKVEFANHIGALNTSFHAWFRDQVTNDPAANLLNGVQDFLDYISHLEDRYLRSYGEVLTFGSGDCA